MRKLTTTAVTALSLITIAWGTAAYAVLEPWHIAPAASVHGPSAHVSHNGRALRHGHTPVFTL